jgi:hypothetical protein
MVTVGVLPLSPGFSCNEGSKEVNGFIKSFERRTNMCHHDSHVKWLKDNKTTDVYGRFGA